MDVDRAEGVDGGAVDLRAHRAFDGVVGHRDTDGKRHTLGAKGSGNRHRHHRRADARDVFGRDRHIAIDVDAGDGGRVVRVQLLRGVADGGERVGVDAVGGAAACTGDRNGHATADRSRGRARKYAGINRLAVDGRNHERSGRDRRLRVVQRIDFGLGVWVGLIISRRLIARERRLDEERVNLVGRLGQQLLPLAGVGQILRKEDVVLRTVFVGVFAFDVIVADVFVDLARACARLCAHQDGVALFDAVGVVFALPVGDSTRVFIRVVADKIAGERHPHRRAKAIAGAHAHADRGRDDGGLDQA